MKVCLINPPHPYLKQPTSQAPLGLLYIASALRAQKIAVDMLDLSHKHYQDKFNVPKADIYGITGTVLDRVPCITVARRIKDRYPTAKVIVGGPISLTPEYITGNLIDAVVQGEGEQIILDVIDDFPNIQELYTANRIQDLDTLPFPARDLIPNLGGNIFAFNKNYRKGGSTVLITSRGCPYACSFCASPGIWKRKVNFRSVENVLAEVDEIKDKYGITQLRFSDDTLTLREARLSDLCAGLAKRDVLWRASLRVNPNSVGMFQEMYTGGCREVSFGIESGDQRVLDTLNKGTTIEDNHNGIVNAKKAGMVVRILFMIGTPGETKETAEKNIAFLERVKESYDTIALTNFIPIPGSAIAEHPEKFACKVVDRDIDHYNFYMWGPDGLNKWDSLVELTDLDKEAFEANKQRMRDYVVSCGKSNHG